MKNKGINMSDDIFDFGFTIVDEDELDAVQEAQTAPMKILQLLANSKNV